MKKSTFINVREVSIELGVSEAHAYKIEIVMNFELKKKGFILISEKVSRLYFNEKVYGSIEGEEQYVSI